MEEFFVLSGVRFSISQGVCVFQTQFALSAYLRLDLLSVFPGLLLLALYLLSGFLLFTLYLLPGPLLLTACGPFYPRMPYPIIIIVSSTPSHLFKMYIFLCLLASILFPRLFPAFPLLSRLLSIFPLAKNIVQRTGWNIKRC